MLALMFQPLKQYGNFQGRARRSELWMFLLLVWGVATLLAVPSLFSDRPGALFWMNIAFCAAMFVPAIAAGVRRLHDTNRSGWWLLLYLVPFGGFVLLVFFVLDSQPGQNRFGPNPKAQN